ncbi:MAG: mechanosensitive ion channel family protein [Acidobacteria bacterium]|nr:mechanosensitive ion channel family protein [Acidobacteriota bacterium]
MNRKIVPHKLAFSIGAWLCIVLSTGCEAQLAKGQPPAATKTTAANTDDLYDRETPRNAVFAFLEACHGHNYERASRYLDTRALPHALDQGTELARQLGEALDRDVTFDVASLSRQPEGDRDDGLPPTRDRVHTFSADRTSVDVQLERVTLRSGLSVWRFSSDTVKLIPKLAGLTSNSPIEKLLPAPLVSWKLMETPVWRWIALVLLAIAVAAFSRLLLRGVLLALKPLLTRLAAGKDLSGTEKLLRPLRVLICLAVFRVGTEWVNPSALPRLYLKHAVAFLAISALAWLCTVIIDTIVKTLRHSVAARHQTLSQSVLPLFSRIMKLVVFLLAVAAVLSDWGYNATAIVAGLGVGGLAIAFAAQKTIENFFGSVSVITDRPVAVGDFCRFGDRLGTVEDIGLRSTRIRGIERTLISVPNSQFSSMTLENFSRRDKMLFHVTLNLRRDTTPHQVRTVLNSLSLILREDKRLETGPLPVRFVGVGTYSLDVELFAYVMTLSGDEFLRIQQDLLLSILDAVAEAGTSLALPTQASVSYSPPVGWRHTDPSMPEPLHRVSIHSS